MARLSSSRTCCANGWPTPPRLSILGSTDQRRHEDRRGHGRRARVQRRPRLQRRRRRRRGHRLGHHHLARRPDLQGSNPTVSRRTAISASPSSSTSSTAARRRTTTTATARTSPASSPATATTRAARSAGIAPDAHLVALKVLDAQRQRHDQQRHRGARLGGRRTRRPTTSASSTCRSARAVTESYWTDPLTLAAKRVVDAGIVVVAAAGNLGKNARRPAAVRRHHRAGQRAVGADRRRLEHEGTLTRSDDTMAAFSSRGPTAIDFDAKPDLVAPGTGTVSLAAPGSTFYHDARRRTC